jgi:hypothetical protein
MSRRRNPESRRLPKPKFSLDPRNPVLHIGNVGFNRHGYPIAYWRTSSGFEVDFILGDGAVAIEAKSTENPSRGHFKGLRAWRDGQKSKRCILDCSW